MKIIKLPTNAIANRSTTTLGDNIRPSWAQLNDNPNVFDLLLGEIKGAATKTASDIAGGASSTIGNTVKDATLAGMTSFVEENPNTVKGVVTTGVIIALGGAAALFCAGMLVGRAKS